MLSVGQVVVNRNTLKTQTVREVIHYTKHRMIYRPSAKEPAKREPGKDGYWEVASDLRQDVTLIRLSGGGVWPVGKLERKYLSLRGRFKQWRSKARWRFLNWLAGALSRMSGALEEMAEGVYRLSWTRRR